MNRLAALSVILILALGAYPVYAVGGAGASSSASIPPLSGIALSGYKQSGQLPPDAVVQFVVGVPLQNTDQLNYLVSQISDPASPMYRHFLTPDQAAQFLPTSQYQSVLAYLKSSGFQIEFTTMDSLIVAQGTVGQIRSSLGIGIESYTNGTYSYYSGVGQPSIGTYVYASNVTRVLFAKPTSMVTPRLISSVQQAAHSFNQTFSITSYPATSLYGVYNTTSLLKSGTTGQGQTVGILDFEGDPLIAQELQYFDAAYNVTAPPSFSVVPIGAYNPNLGLVSGWSGEIALDVEMAHAMAPGAKVVLYAAEDSLPLSAAVGYVVQQHRVDDLSQSFGIPESSFAALGPQFMMFNTVLTDEYYALGSAEGITFIASSGDTGGSGNSVGPLGAANYPASSPYVVSTGGTTTYINPGGTYKETAWSNYGFVPYFVNYGGSTGGVSVVEPMPAYQQGLEPGLAAQGYPNGRMTPDISFNSNIFPGVEAVMQNKSYIVGGTSEASPLFAGMLALAMQKSSGGFGLLNPTLYSMARSSYAKIFHPITFGYNIPWTAASGYNMVTGWGSVNIGEMAYAHIGGSGGLSIRISSPGTKDLYSADFVDGAVPISATVTYKGAVVDTGSFTARVVSLQGSGSAVPLKSVNGKWVGLLPVKGSGISLIAVNGSYYGVSGYATAQTFVGYFGTYFAPAPAEPYSLADPIDAVLNVTTLSGSPGPANQTLSLSSYSIEGNVYRNVGSVGVSGECSYGYYSLMCFSAGSLDGIGAPSGPALLYGTSVYGYLPFEVGTLLQESFILPPVVAEPGVVAPGQSLLVQVQPQAGYNIFGISQETGNFLVNSIDEGSNVSASLVSPTGTIVSSAYLPYTGGMFSASTFGGDLKVPNAASPGLYTVLLSSSYNASGTIYGGSFFGQVYVARSTVTTGVTVTPSPAFEGQTVTITASIKDPSGIPVAYGMYSATLYPATLSNYYSAITSAETIPLRYNGSAWTGTATLPSEYGAGVLSTVAPGPYQYAGPYSVLVSGVSWDGMPTGTGQASASPLTVEPYLFVQGAISALPSMTNLAFSSAAITTVGGTVSNSLFEGTNTISGSGITISSSVVGGTLNIQNSRVTLEGVHADSIVARGSTVTLVDSHVQSLVLDNSTVSMTGSSYGSITPAPPSIAIKTPAWDGVYTGNFNAGFTATGAGISSVSISVDGRQVGSFSGASWNGNGSVQISGLWMPDGMHTFTVTVTQGDGVATSSTAQFFTNSFTFVLALALSAVAFILSVAVAVLYARSRARAKSREPQTRLTEFVDKGESGGA